MDPYILAYGLINKSSLAITHSTETCIWIESFLKFDIEDVGNSEKYAQKPIVVRSYKANILFTTYTGFTVYELVSGIIKLSYGQLRLYLLCVL